MIVNSIRELRTAALIFFLSILFFSCSTSRYTEKNNPRFRERILKTSETIASYYADEFHGRKTASGEIYNMYDLTAAHVSYPLGTIVRVTNLQNDRSVVLKINDRKPPGKNREIDISYKAALELDMIQDGIVKVRVDVLKWGIPEEK